MRKILYIFSICNIYFDFISFANFNVHETLILAFTRN